MNVKEMLHQVYTLAKAKGVTMEKYAEIAISWDEANATERSTKEERMSVMDGLRQIVAANPSGPFDPRDVVKVVGLKQCQADRAYVRHHVAKLQLAYTAEQAAA